MVSLDADDESDSRSSGRALRTPRLVLRRLHPDDAPAIAALAGDRGVASMTASIPHPYSLADAEAYVGASHKAGAFPRAVTLRDTGRFIGIVSLSDRFNGHAAELGYWIGRADGGRGYATEAAQAAVDRAFSGTPVASVLASCRVVNGASRRVLEKCGFQMRRMGTMASVAGGRVAAEDFELDRRAWEALKAWGRT